MCAGLPGGKSITQKRVPFGGGGVPTMRAPMSSIFSPTPISAGFCSVIHISVEREPVPLWLVARPSIRTLATLLASCPVTTRRTGGGRFEKSVAMVVVHSLVCLHRSHHGRSGAGRRPEPGIQDAQSERATGFRVRRFAAPRN